MDGLLKNKKKINKIIKKWYFLYKNEFQQKNWQLLEKFSFPFQFSKLKNKYYNLAQELLEKEIYSCKGIQITKEDINKLSLKFKKSVTLVYINGDLDLNLSSKNFDPFEIKISKLNKPFKSIKSDFFSNLIENLLQKYTNICVPENINFHHPLYFLHINYNNDINKINNSYYYHNLHIGKNTKINIIEQYINLDKGINFTGSRLIIKLEDNAKIIHNKIINENNNSYNFSHNDIKLLNNNSVKSFNFLLGNSITNNKISTQLNGKNSKLIINSLSLPIKKEYVSINSYLEHNSANCCSYQIHKTIVNDQSETSFKGMIKVAKNAINTDGKLINNNLLLNKLSKVYTTPQLEIYSSNVKCSHGATTGKIDKNQIFYLRTRGIKKFLAKKMIIFAFSYTLTEQISNNNIKNKILNIINERLKYGEINDN